MDVIISNFARRRADFGPLSLKRKDGRSVHHKIEKKPTRSDIMTLSISSNF